MKVAVTVIELGKLMNLQSKKIRSEIKVNREYKNLIFNLAVQ